MSISVHERSSLVLFVGGGIVRGEGRIRSSETSVAALSCSFPGGMSQGRSSRVFCTRLIQVTSFLRVTRSCSLLEE